MTKGDLIVACLKLMFESNGDIDADTISSNEDYKEIVENIPDSINRALSVLFLNGKMPLKTFEVNANDNNNDTYFIKRPFDNTFYSKAIKIDYEYKDKIIKNIPIIYENDCLILPKKEVGKYLITCQEYQEITFNGDDTTSIFLPNYILNIIPYYVKGDLYEESQPEKALLAANKFNTYLGLISNRNDTQDKIKTLYKWNGGGY